MAENKEKIRLKNHSNYKEKKLNRESNTFNQFYYMLLVTKRYQEID